MLPLLRENLRRLRLGKGWTQQELAERASLTYKYYQDLEAGRLTGLTLATIEKLAGVLEVEGWKLFHPDVIPPTSARRARSSPVDR